MEDKKEDLCVVCWKPTGYTTDVPLKDRWHYVEGVGQLCYKCWKELYEKDEVEVIESGDYILQDK